MTTANIAALFGTMLVLSVTPGPSDFAIVARSISAGFRTALFMVAGIIVADFLFILLAVYGLVAIAEAMGELFSLVKYAGGVYLIWLGIAAFMSGPVRSESVEPSGSSRMSSFSAGFLITLGDPKAILFYMSLLPGYVDLSSITAEDTGTVMLLAGLTVARLVRYANAQRFQPPKTQLVAVRQQTRIAKYRRRPIR